MSLVGVSIIIPPFKDRILVRTSELTCDVLRYVIIRDLESAGYIVPGSGAGLYQHLLFQYTITPNVPPRALEMVQGEFY